MIKAAQIAVTTTVVLVAGLSSGCGRSDSVVDIVTSPSGYVGKTVSLRDVPVSHYFWLTEAGKGVYEIGGEANIWVVANRPTPQTGDTVNLTGTVAGNFSLGAYYLGLVIVEKSRRLLYDYPNPTGQPVPTHPPSPPQIACVPPQVNLFATPGSSPAPKEVRVGLINEASPNWNARVDKPWLKVGPASGSLSNGDDRITVQADASQFPIGMYSGTMTVRFETKDREVPVRLYVTDGQVGEKIDAQVGQGVGNAWASGIKLDGPVAVSAGQLKRSLFVGTYFYDAGDIAVFLEGTLANDSDSEWQVDFWPEALDAAGNQVAWGLDMGGAPLAGHLQMNIAAHSSRAFTFHMTWAENIERITINANKYPAYPPLP